MEDATKTLGKKEDEMVVLRDELEAQWKNTEKTGDCVARLKEERKVLQSEVVALEARIESMELEWDDADNRRSEAGNTLQVALQKRRTLSTRELRYAHILISLCSAPI